MSCPCGVEPAQTILREQQRYGKEHPQTATHLFFANNYYLSTLGSLTAPLTNIVTSTKLGKKLLSQMGISTHIPLPKFSFHPLSHEKENKIMKRKKRLSFMGVLSISTVRI